MSTATGSSPLRSEPQLLGQTVVVIGGSAGIGLETARFARAEGAKLVLTARHPETLGRAASELGAQQTAAFDATDFAQLERFFNELPTQIDHVLVTGPGPYYAPLAEFDFDKGRQEVEAHLFLPMQVARMARKKVRAGGTLLFIGGTGGRHTAPGMALIGALTAAAPALVRNLAHRDRAGSHQPHRCRVCRHTIVGISARQSARCSPRATPQYAADRARRWPGRHSRTRRAHYDQHSPNRRHLRHRRGATARQAMSPARRDSETDPSQQAAQGRALCRMGTVVQMMCSWGRLHLKRLSARR